MPRPKVDDVQTRQGRKGWYYTDYSGSGNLKFLPGSEGLPHDEQGRHQARTILAELRRRESLGLSPQSIQATAEARAIIVGAPPTSRDKVSIRDLFQIASRRARVNLTKKTADGYVQKWERMERWCASQPEPIMWPSQVTRSLVEKFKAELKAYVVDRFGKRGWDGVRSVNRHLTAWRHAWTLMMNPEDPAIYMFEPGALNLDLLFPLLDEPTREERQVGLTKKQLNALIAAEEDPFYKLKWTFARGSGFRDDEIRHIGVEDFSNPKPGLFLVKVTGKPLGFCRCHVSGAHEKGFEPKRHHKRTVSISQATYTAGSMMIERYEHQLRNPNTKQTWEHLQRTCAHARVPAISMHHFRYNWASHLYHSGKVSLEQLSRLLGHKDVRTTEIYLRIVDTTLLHSSKLPF